MLINKIPKELINKRPLKALTLNFVAMADNKLKRKNEINKNGMINIQ